MLSRVESRAANWTRTNLFRSVRLLAGVAFQANAAVGSPKLPSKIDGCYIQSTCSMASLSGHSYALAHVAQSPSASTSSSSTLRHLLPDGTPQAAIAGLVCDAPKGYIC